MSGFLTETCTISSRSQAISTARMAYTSLDSQTTGVACNFQPDTSAMVILQRQQMGRIGGKLFILASQAIDVDDTVTVRSADWRVSGPPVQALGASTKWVPLEREVP